VADQLAKIFEALASHPSVKRLGWLLSSRRPVYSEAKWSYMKEVHALTKQELERRGLAVTVFDLRDMVHPLSDFYGVDRVHLNTYGHAKKAQKLLEMFAAAWPTEEATTSEDKIAEKDVEPEKIMCPPEDNRYRSPSADSAYSVTSEGDTVDDRVSVLERQVAHLLHENKKLHEEMRHTTVATPASSNDSP